MADETDDAPKYERVVYRKPGGRVTKDRSDATAAEATTVDAEGNRTHTLFMRKDAPTTDAPAVERVQLQ